MPGLRPGWVHNNVFRFENPGKDALEDEEVKAEEDVAMTDPDDDKYKKQTKKLTTWMALGMPQPIMSKVFPKFLAPIKH